MSYSKYVCGCVRVCVLCALFCNHGGSLVSCGKITNADPMVVDMQWLAVESLLSYYCNFYNVAYGLRQYLWLPICSSHLFDVHVTSG